MTFGYGKSFFSISGKGLATSGFGENMTFISGNHDFRFKREFLPWVSISGFEENSSTLYKTFLHCSVPEMFMRVLCSTRSKSRFYDLRYMYISDICTRITKYVAKFLFIFN
jgi:hypothetical protein